MSTSSSPSQTDTSLSILRTDLLVVGGGIAGVFAALAARDQGASVILVDKGSVGKSGLSPWFSVYNFYDPKHSISPEAWKQEQARNGEYLTNLDYVDMYIEDSQARYEKLRTWGITKEDSRGHMYKFRQILKDRGVELIERTMLCELLKKDGRACGGVGFSLDTGIPVGFQAGAVILCSGSGSFKSPGFPASSLTHDGDAMAFRIGAEISGKEFVDFHTTSHIRPADVWGNWGAGWGKELVVTTTTGAYRQGPLDAAFMAHQGDLPFTLKRFARKQRTATSPTVPSSFPDAPFDDPGRTPPGCSNPYLSLAGGATAGMAPHKCEGIFPRDATCASSVEGLFAAGDALCTCGAKYTGFGFSASGSAVQGARAGRHAAVYARSLHSGTGPSATAFQDAVTRMNRPLVREHGYSPSWISQVLLETMTPYWVLSIKSPARLQAALTDIEFFRDHVLPMLRAKDIHDLRRAHEAENMILNAEMKLRASLFRTESRGTHFREDYPARDDDNWLAWIIITQGPQGMVLTKRPIPPTWRPSPGMAYQERYPDRYPGELLFRRDLAQLENPL